MDRKLTAEEQYLLNVRDAAQRLFRSDDGKFIMEFLESTVGWDFPLPDTSLQKANGARGIVCMLKNIQKDVPIDAFLNHCKEYYVGGKLLT
jgi:hypothetical protein